MPTVPVEGGFDEHRYTTWGHRELVRRSVTADMMFTPGSRQHYSNIGYNVLGLLIEKVTGRSYEQEVRDRVIKPNGLKGTYSPGNDPKIHGRHTRGYQLEKNRLVDVTEWSQSGTWASGDLVSTTADLERFMTALFGGRIVPEPELKLMFTTPAVPAYDVTDPANEKKKAVYSSGLTLLGTVDGAEVWGKTGSRYGYLAGFAATRDLSRTLTYSVNATEAKAEKPNPTMVRIATAFGLRPAVRTVGRRLATGQGVRARWGQRVRACSCERIRA
ncbi:serine hydrolase domain-containing protein [Streptomyces stramineus]